MFDELIEHLSDVYALEAADLKLNEFQRGSIYGSHDVIALIEEINLKGFPKPELQLEENEDEV